jgi:hypothetical protein
MPEHYTTRQVAELLRCPEWLVRRVVDRLPEPIGRFGGKRAIPAARLAEIAEAIKERAGTRSETAAL